MQVVIDVEGYWPMNFRSSVRLIPLLFIFLSVSSYGIVLPGCDIVMGHSAGSGVHWESAILTGAEVTTEAEIHRIAGIALAPGPLNTEVQEYLASMGGSEPSARTPNCGISTSASTMALLHFLRTTRS